MSGPGRVARVARGRAATRESTTPRDPANSGPSRGSASRARPGRPTTERQGAARDDAQKVYIPKTSLSALCWLVFNSFQ